ncbi:MULTISPECIES: phosphatase PAP2 family protein [Hungatella]|uniref:phosphatase PAP2 family protein n=1 Tax=Hungatella TaxID=1649459 RepID=UPI000B0BB1F7
MAADTAAVLILALTVVGRMLSGVHWFTDIVAGVILSAALTSLFCLALQYIGERSAKA